MELRPYQKNCIDAILDGRAAGVRRQLAVLFTAAGKTVLFSHLPKYMTQGRRMMVLAHTDELCQQAKDKIQHWNPELRVGLEKAEYRAGAADVVVASVQTLGRTNDRIQQFRAEDFEWLVIDEAHHAIADSYKRVIEHFRLGHGMEPANTTLIGFTATPNRSDGLAMGQVFDKIVFDYGILAGVQDGWLVEPRGYRIRTTTDISNVSSRAGDFAQDELEVTVNNNKRNDLIVSEWVSYAWPRQTIAFCTGIQHAKDLACAFQKSSIPADFIYGADPNRATKMEDLRKGRLQVLTNAQLLTEGFDMWQVSCVVMAKPTKSQTVFVQAAGRALRLQEGLGNLLEARRSGLLLPTHKQDALIIDVCDVTSRHSLVTLPTLFGLGAKLDLKGQSIVKVLADIEEADKANPGIDLSKLEDATRLKSYVEEVGLWTVRFAEETRPYSGLSWHKGPKGNFVLLLPDKGERLVVGENLIGKWSVWGKAGGVGVDEPYYGSLQEALQAAESIVSGLGKRTMSYLRTDAKWTQKKVSDKQRAILRRFKVPEHQIDAMTSGQAGAFITTKFKKKELRGV